MGVVSSMLGICFFHVKTKLIYLQMSLITIKHKKHFMNILFIVLIEVQMA